MLSPVELERQQILKTEGVQKSRGSSDQVVQRSISIRKCLTEN